MRFTKLALVPAVLLAACGSYSDPGSGTQTLYVEAVASSEGPKDTTRIAVRIQEGSSEGDTVSDASVRITSIDGNEYDAGWSGVEIWGWKEGTYVAQNLPWEPGWRIEITRGDDELEGYVAAPGITTITRPISNTTFDRLDGEPLRIEWEDDAGRRAEHVKISFRKAADVPDLQEDPYSYEIQANRLDSGDERITVERWNEVELAGGAPGSKFVARTEHRIELVVE